MSSSKVSRASRRERSRYRFDDFMSKGTGSIFVALIVVFLAGFLIIALARTLVVTSFEQLDVERGQGAWRQFWITFLEMTDPGSMTQDIMSSPWIKMFAMVAGLTGIVLLSALIAFITTTLDRRLGKLRKGHSKVVLEGHTLILGWNDRMIDVLKELIVANESAENPSIVILSQRDKEEMDDELAVQISNAKNTKIVTRSGTESDPVNLSIAAASAAKSVIVLARCSMGASEQDRSNSDLDVIRVLLGLTASVDDRASIPIVAEVFGDRERAAATSIDPRIICVNAAEILAKILVQTSRSEGLSVVYEELLSFNGAEIYFYEDEWGSATIGDLSLRLRDGVAVGIAESDGTIRINPDCDEVVSPGSALIIVASDDSSIEIEATPIAEPTIQGLPDRALSRHLERELLVGWNESTASVIREYADYVTPGSQIDVLLRSPDPVVREAIDRLDAELSSIQVSLLDADPFTPSDLSSLEPFQYDNVIIVSQTSSSGSNRTDSETLLLLLHLKRVFDDHPESQTKLIAELLNSQNRDLVTPTGVREFIISNRIVSMIVAQLSEDRRMKNVYEDLFSELGSEIYLKPMSLYLSAIPASVTFADLMQAASIRGETALGWRSSSSDTFDTNFGVTLIPPKDAVLHVRDGDTLVVVSENEM